MTIANWIALLGILLTGAYVVFGFLVAWHKRSDARHDALAEKVASQDRYMSENYVRGHEMGEVKGQVSALRTEMNKRLDDMRSELSTAINDARKEQTLQMGELSKLVNQLIGKHTA